MSEENEVITGIEAPIYLKYNFTAGAAAARRDAVRLRAALDLPGPYFLAPCRFIPEKNLPRLLEAHARYRSGAGDTAWPLVLVGEGPGRQLLERAARATNGAVRVLGFQSYERMPALYALAGALVLPLRAVLPRSP